MTSQESYTAEALLNFLKQAGMEGLINPATARARRNKMNLLEHGMSITEADW